MTVLILYKACKIIHDHGGQVYLDGAFFSHLHLILILTELKAQISTLKSVLQTQRLAVATFAT